MSPARMTASALLGCAGLFLLFGCDRPDLVQGEVEAAQVDVSAKISGRVEEVLVDVGQSVRKGETLARLASPEIGARRGSAGGASGGQDLDLLLS